jgi:hypothetical protein
VGVLTTQDKILIEQRVANDGPSTAVAYILLLFLGLLGAHRFYLHKTGTAVAMLLLTLTILGIVVSFIWAFVDLFLIPGMAREERERLRERYMVEAMASTPEATAPTPP